MTRRREFLKMSSSAGIVGFTGCQSLNTIDEDITDTEPSTNSLEGYLSGRVVDPAGDPVPGATVRIIDLDQDADEYLETTTRDGDHIGEFVFEELEDEATRREYQNQYDRPSIVAWKNDWFYSVQGEVPTLLNEPQDVELSFYDQILFGPEVAYDQDHPTAVVTVWREVYPDNPAEQTLFIEVTNAAVPDRPHAITDDDLDIDNGLFAVTVDNDDIWIDFGTQTDIDLRRAPVMVAGIDTHNEHPELEGWHPTRTDLPLISVSGLPYPELRSTDADAIETIQEGIGMILRGIPMVSTLLSWLDAIDLLSDQFDREITLGDVTPGVPDPTGDPGAMREFADPNTHTTALLGWEESQKASLLLSVPLELQADTKEAGITIQAEWTHDAPLMSSTHVTFGHTDTLIRGGKVEPTGGEGNNGINSSITTQLVDSETEDQISNGVVLLWPNRMGHGWGPKATDSNGVVTFEKLGEVHSFEGSSDLEIAGVRAHAAGYTSSERRDLSWRPSDGPLDITLEMEAENRDIERSILTVMVDYSDYPEIPSVTVEQNGDVVVTERVNSQGHAQFSLEDGAEYTVSADGVSETRTVTVDGSSEITLSNSD